MKTTTKETTEMTHQEYVARVNEAAGTDIELLEYECQILLEDEDFGEAGRLMGLIWACRAAAGLDPEIGY